LHDIDCRDTEAVDFDLGHSFRSRTDEVKTLIQPSYESALGPLHSDTAKGDVVIVFDVVFQVGDILPEVKGGEGLSPASPSASDSSA